MKSERHCTIPSLFLRRTGHAEAHPTDSFHIGTLGAKFLTQTTDVRVQRTRCCFAMIAPHLIHQVLTGQHIPAGTHEFV